MSSQKTNEIKDWKQITPEVNDVTEFLEITSDFGEPLEIVREAISNSIDWGASFIEISFYVKKYKGASRLFISLLDDGSGMTEEVITKGPEGIFEAYCDEPLASLFSGKLHKPHIRQTDTFLKERDDIPQGTKISIIGYNDNVRSRFIQNIVRDYILWFTKVGSIEKEFSIKVNEKFRVLLKCIGCEEFEEIKFGHVFPKENKDIDKLFDKYEGEAADYYVKKWIWKDQPLDRHPEVTYSSVYYIEGDQIKREYNPMIRARRDSRKGTYRVSDRYGLWICKDYIPIAWKNEWVINFGTGSNSIVMIHGFVNCQDLMLTANRGDIANINEGKELIIHSFPIDYYEPAETQDWDIEYARYLKVNQLPKIVNQ